MYKILVSAYACEPGRGSEGEIGWSIVHELSKHHNVWVITRANNKVVHDAAFVQEKKPKNLFFSITTPPNGSVGSKKGNAFS